MSYSSFKNDTATKYDITTTGNVRAKYIFGNAAFLTNTPSANIGNLTADVSTTGNVRGNFILGNGAFLTNVPSANIGNLTTDVSTTGNVRGNFILGNGAFLTSVIASLPSSIPRDIIGNVNGITTTSAFGAFGNLYTQSANGVSLRFGANNWGTGFFTNGVDGENAASTLTGDLVIRNSRSGARTAIASSYNLPEITVFNRFVGINKASPVVSLDVVGAANFTGALTAASLTAPLSFNTSTGNGAGYRFGPAFTTGVFTNATDGEQAANTFVGDMVIRNSQSGGRTVITSSYNLPEITVFNRRVGINNATPTVPLDVVGAISASNISVSGFSQMNSVYFSAPTNTVNILQLGGTQATTSSTNVFGLGRNSASLRLNTMASGTFEFSTNGTTVANIGPTGNLIIAGPDATKLTGTTWSTGSDRRIKSNIIPANLDTCLDVVRNLDLKRFEWGPQVNVNDRHVLGWIAQEVEDIFPKSVKTTAAYGLPDAKILDADQLFINMYGALKKSVQIIDNLVERVAKLERK